MEKIVQEILILANNLLIHRCLGCLHEYLVINNSCRKEKLQELSDKDHSCLNWQYYNLELKQAIEEIKDKYNIEESLDFIYEQHCKKLE